MVAASPPPLRASASAPAAPGFRLPDRPQGPLPPALRARLGAGGASFPPSVSAAAGRPLSGLHGSERPLASLGPRRCQGRPGTVSGFPRHPGDGSAAWAPARCQPGGKPRGHLPAAPRRRPRPSGSRASRPPALSFPSLGQLGFSSGFVLGVPSTAIFQRRAALRRGRYRDPRRGSESRFPRWSWAARAAAAARRGGCYFGKGGSQCLCSQRESERPRPPARPRPARLRLRRGRGGAKCSAGGAAAPAERAEQTREPGRGGCGAGGRSRAAGGWRRAVRWNHLWSGPSRPRVAQLASGRGHEAGGPSPRVQSHLRFPAFAGCALALSPPASSLQQPPKVRPATWGETLPPSFSPPT